MRRFEELLYDRKLEIFREEEAAKVTNSLRAYETERKNEISRKDKSNYEVSLGYGALYGGLGGLIGYIVSLIAFEIIQFVYSIIYAVFIVGYNGPLATRLSWEVIFKILVTTYAIWFGWSLGYDGKRKKPEDKY